MQQLTMRETAVLRGAAKPFQTAQAPRSRVPARVAASRSASSEGPSTSRRETLQLGGLAGLALAFPGTAAAKGLKGFNAVKDTQDGYSFVYPFGWQELTVEGQDVVFKDVIEPLESVSVSLVDTEKGSVREFGDIAEVAYTLADKVLTGPQQPVKVLSTKERTDEGGRPYYQFEFTVDAGRYTRHAVAAVAVGNGKFYTLVTGANERRWGKMKDKLTAVVGSFEVFDRFNS